MDGLQLLKCRLAGQMVADLEKVPEEKQGKTIKEARTMLTRVLVDMGVVRGRGQTVEEELQEDAALGVDTEVATPAATPKRKRK